jgi:hypothetical protein
MKKGTAGVVGAIEKLAAERDLTNQDRNSVVCSEAALVEISRLGQSACNSRRKANVL